MARKVTLFTGQWADLPIAKLSEMASEFGYDGLELACWGDHMELEKASKSKSYCDDKRDVLAQHGLGCWAISNHLSGQLLCDNIDERHYAFLPKGVKRTPADARKWSVNMAKMAGKAAVNMDVGVINGFTGSPIWHLLYSFPPCLPKQIDSGFKQVAKTLKPILDTYQDLGVKFALEVHPTEIAFDIASSERLLDALDNHPAFGFNYDPSHLAYQGVDYVKFIRKFGERIFHVHMKDVWWGHGDGTVGVFGGHTDFADPRRYWDFRSLGHGDVQFEDIIVALNDVKYQGPLSVEWEDSRMERCYGAKEACAFVRGADFSPSDIAFDAQFDR